MKPKLYLAIDQGGQSSRVAVYRESGELLHVFSAACATHHYRPDNFPMDFIEQDGEEILHGIKHCLQQIAHVLGDDVRQIVAAGFAGQGSSLLCWDTFTGKALSPVLSWQDIRGDEILKTIPLTHQQAQEFTGLRVSPHYGATKIRWCLLNNPAVMQAIKEQRLSVGPIVSFIFWHLLNPAAKNLVDPGHAQRTLLWNLQSQDWDETLLALFQIPKAILPQCLHHNDCFGRLNVGEYQVPLMASARDQGASLFARGLPDKNICYINIGTGAFIQRVSASLHAPDGLLVSPLWLPADKQLPSLYAWEATVNGAASAIPFVQQQTGLDVSPEDIQHALERHCTGYFLNAIGGLGAPYWRTDVQSQFSENLNVDEKICAWIESIIFQITVNVQLMNTLGPPSKIIISGGLSRANAVCQKLADLTQVPVHRSENSDATLQGITCMAAGIPRQWQINQAEEKFTPQHNPLLLNSFALWQNAIQDWLA